MKLYKCQMLDDSMPDWEECVVAVMESIEEQNTYYENNGNRDKIRQTLLSNSGYKYNEFEIEFWFPYELDGIRYADDISQNNICLSVWDTYYENFELIKPQAKTEDERMERKIKIFFKGANKYESISFNADNVTLTIEENGLFVRDKINGKIKFMIPLYRVVYCEEIWE